MCSMIVLPTVVSEVLFFCFLSFPPKDLRGAGGQSLDRTSTCQLLNQIRKFGEKKRSNLIGNLEWWLFAYNCGEDCFAMVRIAWFFIFYSFFWDFLDILARRIPKTLVREVN